MISILLAGLLSAAPQSAASPAYPSGSAAALIPAGTDTDAVCAVLMTEIDVRYDKMPAADQAKYKDFHDQTERAADFYLGAASARRSASELAPIAAAAAKWSLAQTNDVKSSVVAACLKDVPGRFQIFADGLKSK